MLDLLLMPSDRQGRQAGLEDALRGAIASGQLPQGVRLPSTRALASELGCARATVVGAYEQLTAEGLLVAVRGAGTHVAAAPGLAPQAAAPSAPVEARRYDADFRPGEPDRGSFPRRDWAASIRRVLSTAPDDLFGYGDPRGLRELRVALASYLGRSRAVRADPEHIVIFSGFAQALSVLAETLRTTGLDTIAIEDPALPFHPEFCARAGLAVTRVPVDEDGLRVDVLDDTGARAALVTPAHQYPLGVAMAPARRVALVEWARRRDGWIVEDDYDGEFRYDRQPVGAMHGLDPSRVVYGGTASKSLAAGLHIAWLVLPPSLVEPVTEASRWRVGVSAIDQAALADFITTGHLDRHLRQMRVEYRRRRDEVMSTLRANAPWMTMSGVSAGLHGTVLLDGPPSRELDVLAQAQRSSVGFHPLSAHRDAAGRPGLVIGYSRPAAHEFRGALERLGQLVSALPVPDA